MSDSSVLDLDDLWQRSLQDLQQTMTGAAQRAWLDDTRPVGFSQDTVVLAAPHSFAREQLDTRYGPALRAALTKAAGRALQVVVTVRPDPQPEPPAEAAAPERSAPATVTPRESYAPESFPRATDTRDTALNEKYTFDRFVIGASNRFAHAASFAVAEAPAKAYNPLFVYGGAGLGKTHLLQAVGHYTLGLYPHLKVRYVTSEQFTNEFIDAIGRHRQVPFQRRYRDVDVLLIDDIQFLENREGLQEEFFHTFNSLHGANKQIVISSDRVPDAIPTLEERLRGRFKWGLITDIQPPDLETRLAILRNKAERDHVEVPAETLEFIATKISTNIRELEGALIRVTAYASLNNVPITTELAQQLLADLLSESTPRQRTDEELLAEIADFLGFDVAALKGKSRQRPLVTARQIAMYVFREVTDLSYPGIARIFGGRDHTTVIHAVEKIQRQMSERKQIYDQVTQLQQRLKS